MEFKAEEIDTVIGKMLEYDAGLYAIDFQKKHLPDWQLLKVKSIFKYLYDNHIELFDDAQKNDIDGYSLEIGEKRETWKSELEKGGFTSFWKKKEDFKTTLKNVLTNANSSVSLVQSAVALVDNFF